MASPDRSLPPLPFGFAAPSAENLGWLGREILRSAGERVEERQRRSRLLLVPALAFYVLYGFCLSAVLWALGVELAGPGLVAVQAAVFLLMALLGQYFHSDATWESLQGGMGTYHRVLLVQAFIARAATAAFFVLPWRVLSMVAHLFPRSALVDRQVLSYAAQLGAALDQAVPLEALVAAVPEVPRPVVEEATLLLQWAGLAEVVQRSGRRVLAPTPRRDNLVLSLGQAGAGLVRVSDLQARPPGTAVPGPTRGIAAFREEQGEPPAWLRPLRDKPIHVLAVCGGVGVVAWLVWSLGSAWYRKLPVTLEPAALPVVDVDSVSVDGGSFLLGKGGEVRVTPDLDLYPETTYSLLGLRRVWAGEGGVENASGKEQVYFERVDHAERDPSGRHLLVYGTWRYYKGHGSSGGPTELAVVDLEAKLLLPARALTHGQQAVKGWWDAGRLLVVRSPAASDQGGGGRVSSDNLAPTALAVDVRSGAATEVLRPVERYFALAGEEDGARVFLAADWSREVGGRTGRFRCSEYRDLRRVRTFAVDIPARDAVLRQAELDATGAYWVLVVEVMPPPASQRGGSRHTVWLVARRGGRLRQVVDGEKSELRFLQSFVHRGRPLLVALREARPPEVLAWRIAEE